VLAASAAYDYQLQNAHLEAMEGRGTCGAVCLAVQQEAALSLQVRAVGLGSLLVLASNLVLVVLVVAMRGGRLELTSPPRRSPAHVRDDLTSFLAAGLFGAAVIHAAVVPEHIAEWTAAGVFFVVLSAAELAGAAAVLLSGRPVVLIAAAALSVGPLLLWAYSRTRGLPFGPEAGVAEAIGPADVAASLLEAATLAAAIVCLRARVRPRRPRTSSHLGRLALVAVVAVTVIGLGGDLTLVSGAAHDAGLTARG
jgi:hypothetical protein